jgi:branched-chain amino acid transport system ATP-binding protein
VLEIENLVIKYGGAYALRGISLEIQNGEFVSIIGANGAGKTTLLRGVSRLIPIFSGKIVFNSEKINSMAPWRVVSKYLGWRQVKQRLSLVYEIFPVLRERKNQQARTMSGGEQQMLAIGRALMGNPKLLMLDEVTLGLAPVLVNLMRSKLEQLHELKISILLAEQNAEMALSISSKCYVMEYGQICKEGNAIALRDDPEVKAAYLGL